jgi:Lar family restriction alleviation protein
MIENTKPCPFCGTSRIIDFIETAVEGDDHHIQILCDGCGTTTGGYATKDEAIAFWNTRYEINSSEVIKRASSTSKKSFTACVVVEHTVTILADDLEEATELAEACGWEEGSDMSPDFEDLKWIEEDE